MTTNIYIRFTCQSVAERKWQENERPPLKMSSYELVVTFQVAHARAVCKHQTMLGKMARKQITSIHKYTSKIRHISNTTNTAQHSTRCFHDRSDYAFCKRMKCFRFPFFRLEFFARIFFHVNFNNVDAKMVSDVLPLIASIQIQIPKSNGMRWNFYEL